MAADASFEADSLEDAFIVLAAHFEAMSSGDVEASPLEITKGTIEVYPE